MAAWVCGELLIFHRNQQFATHRKARHSLRRGSDAQAAAERYEPHPPGPESEEARLASRTPRRPRLATARSRGRDAWRPGLVRCSLDEEAARRLERKGRVDFSCSVAQPRTASFRCATVDRANCKRSGRCSP